MCLTAAFDEASGPTLDERQPVGGRPGDHSKRKIQWDAGSVKDKAQSISQSISVIGQSNQMSQSRSLLRSLLNLLRDPTQSTT